MIRIGKEQDQHFPYVIGTQGDVIVGSHTELDAFFFQPGEGMILVIGEASRQFEIGRGKGHQGDIPVDDPV